MPLLLPKNMFLTHARNILEINYTTIKDKQTINSTTT